VLIVDDEESIRITLREFLRKDGYEVKTAGDVGAAQAILAGDHVDIVVTDVVLPRTSGVELLHALRSASPDIQVILMTGDPNVETAREAVRAGASDYLSKPICKSAILRAVGHAASIKELSDQRRRLQEENLAYQHDLERRVEERTKALREKEQMLASVLSAAPVGIGILEGRTVRFVNRELCEMVGRAEAEMLGQDTRVLYADAAECERIDREVGCAARATGLTTAEVKWRHSNGAVLDVLLRCAPLAADGQGGPVTFAALDVTERKRAEREVVDKSRQVRMMMEGAIQAVSAALEKRDMYTAGHERRVSHLAAALARSMGYSDARVEGVQIAGYVHDIGKIAVPAEILAKPTRLNFHEFGIMKSHPEVGYEILKGIAFEWPVAQATLQHHERLDGSGYPAGLKDDQVLAEARLLGVADVVEAMASHRPYRPALGHEAALAEITAKAGVLYDPNVVKACVRLFTQEGYRLP
jgi:PAS domain S-box-containing protein/putative nucleotidyltransferase with HDIG domain